MDGSNLTREETFALIASKMAEINSVMQPVDPGIYLMPWQLSVLLCFACLSGMGVMWMVKR